VCSYDQVSEVRSSGEGIPNPSVLLVILSAQQTETVKKLILTLTGS
jgi:hypothetical protein